jgi:nucleotide-binding universal stress UspA family protein
VSIAEMPNSPTRIVVGVDGSEPSKNALRWAHFVATAAGTYLEAVAAWEPFTAFGWIGVGWVTVPSDWNPALDAEKLLTATVDEVFAGERPAGLQLTVREGNAAKVLLEVSVGARMLVVGSRGHGGFTGLLLGSVSAACAEHATCPVLVLHGDTTAPVTVRHSQPSSPTDERDGPLLDADVAQTR